MVDLPIAQKLPTSHRKTKFGEKWGKMGEKRKANNELMNHPYRAW